jgi:nucleotide-binding universal stress UspA family protein
MFKRILFAHNATSAAERALFYVEHLARVERAEVLVLHVYQLPERYADTEGYEALVHQIEGIAREIVNDMVEQLQEEGISAYGMICTGKPGPKILETAREEDVSLIVLGTRGPSNVKDFLLGDVSTEVLRFARCPVFLVP